MIIKKDFERTETLDAMWLLDYCALSSFPIEGFLFKWEADLPVLSLRVSVKCY